MPLTTERRNAVRDGAIAFVASRLFVLIGALIASAAGAAERARQGIPKPGSAARSTLDALGRWDGTWYLRVAELGYPESVPAGVTYGQIEARAAFFPGFPSLIKVADPVVPGGRLIAALLVNLVLGAAFVTVVGAMTRQVAGEQVAGRAMVLTAMFPGSVVLSMAYSEALMVLAAAGALWCLHSRRWLAAGLLAAVASFTRFNGLAVAAACAVAAVIAVRRRREWSALIAAVIAPLGGLAALAVIGGRAGEAGVWFRVQREAWKEGNSFGGTALRGVGQFVINPFASPSNALTTGSLVALLIGAYAARRARVPATWLTYSAVIAALMLLPSTITARPRFVFSAFPLLIAVAIHWPEIRPQRWTYLMSACAAGLVALGALYGLDSVVIP